MIEPLFPLGLSIIIAVITVAILIYFETRRRLKFLSLRIVSQVLFVGSVLLLTLRPSIVSPSKSESVLLVTEGHEQKTIDSLLDKHPSLKASPNTSVNNLPGNIEFITGNGLPSWALELLPSKNYSFIPSSSPTGITAIETDEHIYAHRWNEIRGTYNGESTLLKLRGPGGLEDSVQVSSGPFLLSFFAKAPGRFNYKFISGNKEETLPLFIEPERTFNIIFISDYPTFEMRYLKNFLAPKGHRLSIRNQVSRGLYKFEFANRPASNFQSLTPALLNATDLLTIDERSWHSLNANDQKNVLSAISDGLGVIVMPEAKPEKHREYLLKFAATQEKDTVRVSLGRPGAFRLPALPLEVKGSTALLTATDKRIVSGYLQSGGGKVGYQLLMETFQLGLQGKAEAYSSLWVPLLEKCARTTKNDLKLKITSPFPYYENEPISFDIVSSGGEPKLKIDNVDFPLMEDVYIDDLWHGTTWLDGNKWHDFTMDSATTAVHVAKANGWRSVYASNNRKATALQAGQQTNSDIESPSKDDRAVKIFLFVIFLLAGGFLWLAPKL